MLPIEYTYFGDAVPNGFYDSLLNLKTLKPDKIQEPMTFERYEDDFDNIINISSAGKEVPRILLEDSTKILKRIRPKVGNYHCITSNHFLHAGEAGTDHFHLLLEVLIKDVNNFTISEVNTVHAAILFKGHSKDKSFASSY